MLKLMIGVLMVLSGSAVLIDYWLREAAFEETKTRIKNLEDKIKEIDFNGLVARSHDYFIELFDRFYGEHHFTWKCFTRSIFSSLFAISVCFYIYVIVIHDSFLAGYREAMASVALNGLAWAAALVLGNLFADYVSLVETRFVLRYARMSVWGLVLLVIFDVILSYMIYEAIATPLFDVFISWFSGSVVSMPNLFHEYWLQDLTAPFRGTVTAPFILSTFFTSFVFYIFVGWFFLMKLAKGAHRSLLELLRILSITKYPAKMVAVILSSTVAIGEGLYYIFDA